MAVDTCIDHVLENIGKWTKPHTVETPMIIGPAQSVI